MSAKYYCSARCSAFQIGQSQFKIPKERLNAVNMKPTSLYASISINKLKIFKCKVTKEKKQALAL